VRSKEHLTKCVHKVVSGHLQEKLKMARKMKFNQFSYFCKVEVYKKAQIQNENLNKKKLNSARKLNSHIPVYTVVIPYIGQEIFMSSASSDGRS
jgi:ribosomal protein L39E